MPGKLMVTYSRVDVFPFFFSFHFDILSSVGLGLGLGVYGAFFGQMNLWVGWGVIINYKLWIQVTSACGSNCQPSTPFPPTPALFYRSEERCPSKRRYRRSTPPIRMPAS